MRTWMRPAPRSAGPAARFAAVSSCSCTPKQPEQIDKELATLAAYRDAGCQHAVLSFYQPPDVELLQRCAAL